MEIYSPSENPMNYLIVVTPVSRFHNIPIMQFNIDRLKFAIKDTIFIWATDVGGPWGNDIREKYTQEFPGFWIMYLDDDNYISEDAIEFIKALFIKPVEPRAYIFNQIHGTKGGLRCEAKPDNMVRGKVDAAQILVHGHLCRDIHWNLEEHDADGMFIEELYKSCPEKFVFVPEVTVWYNALR